MKHHADAITESNYWARVEIQNGDMTIKRRVEAPGEDADQAKARMETTIKTFWPGAKLTFIIEPQRGVRCLLLFFVLLAFSGCGQHIISPLMTEPATLYDVAFVPAGHGEGLTYTPGKGSGLGIASVEIAERYALVFECQHGRWVYDGKEAKRLYKTLSRGDAVTIEYVEVFKVYQGKTNFVDYGFIDAKRRDAR